MTDDNTIDLEARRRKVRGKLGEPVATTAEIARQIRAYKVGYDLFGKPPCRGEPPLDPSSGLPPNCPVRPLGRDGDTFYFLNAAGGLGELTPSSAGKGHIDALFAGQSPYLRWAWGRVKWVKGGPIDQDNYDAEKVRETLFNAASDKGNWNKVDMVRGRGAWLGKDDELILHLGDHLLIDGRTRAECGERDGFLYPGRPPIVGPHAENVPEGRENPATKMLELLRSWNWERPDVDPEFLLGWICQAMVSGALSWRSTIFITGDQATGKSTVQKAVFAALGGAVIHAVETTPAGIYQMLKNDSLPVTVDELESDGDSRKKRGIIELARVANSGGRMLRGGQDHNGQQFNLRSAFLFSSINAPALQPQDRSRMGLLNLKELEKVEGRSGVDLSEVALWGRQMFRRILDWWPKLETMREEIAHWLKEEAGHDGRGADTFGTLIAFAHAAQFDTTPTDKQLIFWCDKLRASRLAEMESRTANWKLCLRHLLQVRADALRQSLDKTVGALLARFAEGDKLGNGDICDATWLRGKLAEVGLGLSGAKRGKPDAASAWLFVPNDHSSLSPLFDGTKWQAEGGAPGVWTDALRQAGKWDPKLNPSGLYRQGNGRVGAMPLRGTLLRLDGLFKAVGDAAMEGTEEDEGDEVG